MTRRVRHPLVKLCGASRTYGSGSGAVEALSDASLTINAGEFVAIVGRSGSGKSTLMNLIGLLDRPSEGAVFIDGMDAGRLPCRQQARIRNMMIGFIFQAYHLMPRRTALANVALPLAYRGLSRRQRNEQALAALEAVGLTHRATARPPQMSGGEQQRVAIARALVTEPKLLIADEPTGALDTGSAELVLAQLDAAAAAGRTVVMVTHDPAVAARAHRQVHMLDGRIVSDSVAFLPQPEAA